MEDFVNRESQFPNRRRLEIVSQTPNEIIANIYRDEGNVDVEGTPITAKTLNDMKKEFANRGTTINVNGEAQSSINFASDPQTQINTLNTNLSAQQSNKANIDASNLTTTNITNWKNKCGFKSIETIYDNTSSDSNLNWGYTSGIKGGVTISNKDFSKYKNLIIYYTRGYLNVTYILDLNANNTTTYQASGVFQLHDQYGMHFITSTTEVNLNKNMFTHTQCGISQGTNFTNENNISNLVIYRIEGVY